MIEKRCGLLEVAIKSEACEAGNIIRLFQSTGVLTFSETDFLKQIKGTEKEMISFLKHPVWTVDT